MQDILYRSVQCLPNIQLVSVAKFAKREAMQMNKQRCSPHVFRMQRFDTGKPGKYSLCAGVAVPTGLSLPRH